MHVLHRGGKSISECVHFVILFTQPSILGQNVSEINQMQFWQFYALKTDTKTLYIQFKGLVRACHRVEVRRALSMLTHVRKLEWYKMGKIQLQARQDPDTRRPRPSFQGWEFAHRFFERIACFLWAKEGKCDSQIKLSIFSKERRERIADSSSFVMSDLSELLRSLFCKEQEEQIAQVAL